MESITEPLLKTLPYNSWKKRCFLFRYALDQSSHLLVTLQIVLGSIVTLHPCLSFAILTVILIQISDNYDRFELSLIPLISLCIEALIFASTTLMIFFSENSFRDHRVTSWHRESILSLLKDMYVALMVLIALVLFIIYIETEENKLTFHSVTIMTMPLTILMVSSLIKFILLKTRRVFMWITIAILILIEISMLCLRVDKGWDIDWIYILLPYEFVFLTLLWCAIESMVNRLKANDKIGIFFSLIVIIGDMCGIILFVVLYELITYGENAFIEFEVWGWVTISLLGTGYSRKCGAWVFHVIFGHIETDYWHFIHPTKYADMPDRSKSY